MNKFGIAEKSIKVIVPHSCSPDTWTVDYIVEKTNELWNPFLCLMGLRFWLAAKQSGNVIEVADGTVLETDTIYLCRDFFAKYLLDTALFSEANLRESGSILLVIGANISAGGPVGLSLSSWWTDLLLNVEENNISFSKEKFIQYGSVNPFEKSMSQAVIPISMSKEILPNKKSRRDRIIFVDEPHEEVIKRLRDNSNVYSVLFKHCLDICGELRKYGFTFRTFSRNLVNRDLQNLYKRKSYLDVVSRDSWVPYREIVDLYATGNMFFNFFPETFGFPIYENMQMGNAIISYSEIANLLNLRSMQNSVLVSLYQSPKTCARIINEYWDLFQENGFHELISAEANERYSTETYAERLLRQLNR
ncbi:glycosyltransferase [Rhizobium hainanense]|uniref:Uncharacterized protein n=1 Tax=Rhizobium hainanense TaxID=52131 RepID=A0A1C3W236_9HYPH|nr:glycosyltransferase [Rhizobium hainanense]SCB33971.1 hypothetical protein GA0061100_11083 [Rhizobium hainanense]